MAETGPLAYKDPADNGGLGNQPRITKKEGSRGGKSPKLQKEQPKYTPAEEARLQIERDKALREGARGTYKNVKPGGKLPPIEEGQEGETSAKGQAVFQKGSKYLEEAYKENKSHPAVSPKPVPGALAPGKERKVNMAEAKIRKEVEAIQDTGERKRLLAVLDGRGADFRRTIKEEAERLGTRAREFFETEGQVVDPFEPGSGHFGSQIETLQKLAQIAGMTDEDVKEIRNRGIRASGFSVTDLNDQVRRVIENPTPGVPKNESEAKQARAEAQRNFGILLRQYFASVRKNAEENGKAEGDLELGKKVEALKDFAINKLKVPAQDIEKAEHDIAAKERFSLADIRRDIERKRGGKPKDKPDFQWDEVKSKIKAVKDQADRERLLAILGRLDPDRPLSDQIEEELRSSADFERKDAQAMQRIALIAGISAEKIDAHVSKILDELGLGKKSKPVPAPAPGPTTPPSAPQPARPPKPARAPKPRDYAEDEFDSWAQSQGRQAGDPDARNEFERIKAQKELEKAEQEEHKKQFGLARKGLGALTEAEKEKRKAAAYHAGTRGYAAGFEAAKKRREAEAEAAKRKPLGAELGGLAEREFNDKLHRETARRLGVESAGRRPLGAELGEVAERESAARREAAYHEGDRRYREGIKKWLEDRDAAAVPPTPEEAERNRAELKRALDEARKDLVNSERHPKDFDDIQKNIFLENYLRARQEYVEADLAQYLIEQNQLLEERAKSQEGKFEWMRKAWRRLGDCNITRWGWGRKLAEMGRVPAFRLFGRTFGGFTIGGMIARGCNLRLAIGGALAGFGGGIPLLMGAGLMAGTTAAVAAGAGFRMAGGTMGSYELMRGMYEGRKTTLKREDVEKMKGDEVEARLVGLAALAKVRGSWEGLRGAYALLQQRHAENVGFVANIDPGAVATNRAMEDQRAIFERERGQFQRKETGARLVRRGMQAGALAAGAGLASLGLPKGTFEKTKGLVGWFKDWWNPKPPSGAGEILGPGMDDTPWQEARAGGGAGSDWHRDEYYGGKPTGSLAQTEAAMGADAAQPYPRAPRPESPRPGLRGFPEESMGMDQSTPPRYPGGAHDVSDATRMPRPEGPAGPVPDWYRDEYYGDRPTGSLGETEAGMGTDAAQPYPRAPRPEYPRPGLRGFPEESMGMDQPVPPRYPGGAHDVDAAGITQPEVSLPERPAGVGADWARDEYYGDRPTGDLSGGQMPERPGPDLHGADDSGWQVGREGQPPAPRFGDQVPGGTPDVDAAETPRPESPAGPGPDWYDNYNKRTVGGAPEYPRPGLRGFPEEPTGGYEYEVSPYQANQPPGVARVVEAVTELSPAQIMDVSGLRPEYYNLIKDMTVEEYLEKSGMALNYRNQLPFPKIDGEYPWFELKSLAHNRWMDYRNLQKRLGEAIAVIPGDKDELLRNFTVDDFIKRYASLVVKR